MTRKLEAPIDEGNPWDKVRQISQRNEQLRAEIERLNLVIDSAAYFLVEHGYLVQASQLRARRELKL